jgi:hypothetical protein
MSSVWLLVKVVNAREIRIMLGEERSQILRKRSRSATSAFSLTLRRVDKLNSCCIATADGRSNDGIREMSMCLRWVNEKLQPAEKILVIVEVTRMERQRMYRTMCGEALNMCWSLFH